jgi:hypothetical protein
MLSPTPLTGLFIPGGFTRVAGRFQNVSDCAST